MAMVFAGTHQVWKRKAGTWVRMTAADVAPSFMSGSWGLIYQAYLMRAGTWQLQYTTNAHQPQAAPISVTLTITGTAFARHCKVDWTNPSPPGTYNAYNTFIRFTNNTDPTKTVTNNISPNGGVVTFTIAAAGASGDSVTVDVWFNDGTFDGPTSTVSTTM
jgi:hypothetical protein